MGPELTQRALVVLAAGELLLARFTGGPLPGREVALWAVGWLLVGALAGLPRIGPGLVLAACAAIGTSIALPPVLAVWGLQGGLVVAASLSVLAVSAAALGADLQLLAMLTLFLSVGAACLPGVAVPTVPLMAAWVASVGAIALIAARPVGSWFIGALSGLIALTPLSNLPREDARPDVVVVTVSGLRADAADTMESYRRLAQRGRAYEGWAPAPWTLPSLAALWTGIPPHANGVGRRGVGFVGLDADARTLAERLAAEGWHTVALSGPAAASGHRYGLLQGFEETHHPWDAARAPLPRTRAPHAAPRPLFARALLRPEPAVQPADLVDAALLRLSAPDGPRFVWLHLPALAPPWPDAPCRPDVLAAPGAALRMVGDPFFTTEPGAACLQAGYAQAVARVDAQLLRLLDGLDLDRTVVVLTSDHGLALGEAGVGDGHTLDPVVSRIPLVMALPGATPPAVPGPVSLVDVGVTLESALGLTPSLPGLDLLHAKRAGPTVLSGTLHGPVRTAVVDGPWMLESVLGRTVLRRWAQPGADETEAHPEVVTRLARWML